MIPERPSGRGAELKEPGDTPTSEAVLAVLFGGWFFVFAAISWWGISELYMCGGYCEDKRSACVERTPLIYHEASPKKYVLLAIDTCAYAICVIM